jgi:hypothetical protein
MLERPEECAITHRTAMQLVLQQPAEPVRRQAHASVLDVLSVPVLDVLSLAMCMKPDTRHAHAGGHHME